MALSFEDGRNTIMAKLVQLGQQLKLHLRDAG